MQSRFSLSPLIDLFVTVSFVFIIFFLAKDGPGADGTSYDKIYVKRGGIFAVSSNAILIESAPYIRQFFLNRIFSLHQEWHTLAREAAKDATGAKDTQPDYDTILRNTQSYFEITANSDALLKHRTFDNWFYSSQRALTTMRLGFLSPEEFNGVLINTMLGELREKGDRAFNDALRRLESLQEGSWGARRTDRNTLKLPPETMQWAYSNNYVRSTPKDPTAILLLWWPRKNTRDCLLIKMRFSGISFILRSIADDQLAAHHPTMRKLMRYRESDWATRVDFELLDLMLNEFWTSLAKGEPEQMISDTEPPLDRTFSSLGNNHDIAEQLHPYVPFFQIATRGSFDSKSFADREGQKDIDWEYGIIEAQLRRFSEQNGDRVGTAYLDKLLGLLTLYRGPGILKKANEYFVLGATSHAEFFADNQARIRFYISNKRNRCIFMRQIKQITVEDTVLYQIREVLGELHCSEEALATPEPASCTDMEPGEPALKHWDYRLLNRPGTLPGQTRQTLVLYRAIRKELKKVLSTDETIRRHDALFPSFNRQKNDPADLPAEPR